LRQELAGAEGSKRPSEFEAQLAESQEEQARLRRELGQVRQPAAPASGEPPMMVAQGVKRLTEALAAEIKRREGPERQATELGEQRSQLEGQLAQARLRREQSRQELQARAERSATEQTRLEARVAELQSARAEVEKRLQQLTETLTKETESRQDVEHRAGQLTQERQQLEAALAENREAQTHLREQAQATEDRLRALQEKSRADQARLEDSVGRLESAKMQLQERLKQLAETLAGETQRRETAEGRIGELDGRRSELEAELANNQQSLATAQHRLLDAQRQLELQGTQFTALQSEARALEQRTEELNAQLADRRAEEQRLRQRTTELEQCIRRQTDELAAWTAADAAQKADLKRLHATLDELRIIQSALCSRVRDLTAEQERAADRIRQLTDDAREAARLHQTREQELAGLRHAVLEADLSNGLRLTRRIELGFDGEEVTVSTTVTNVSGQVRTAAPRSHPAFAVTFAPGSRVQIRRPDGTWRAIEFATKPDEEQSVWLEGDEVPTGEWSIEDNGSGLRLVCTFDRTPIAKCLLNWSGPQKRVNLELFAAEKELAPGQSITLKQVWRIEPLA